MEAHDDQALYPVGPTSTETEMFRLSDPSAALTKRRFSRKREHIPVGMSQSVDPDITFRPLIALKEFAYNFVPVLNIPIVIAIEGYHGARNRMFVGWGNPFVPIWFYISCLIYLSNILYFYYEPVDITFAEILLADGLFLLRTAVIGTKYGYLKKRDYDSLNSGDKLPLQSRAQLLSGWRVLPNSQIVEELEIAAKRRGVDLDSYFLFDETEKAMMPFHAMLSDVPRSANDELMGTDLKRISLRLFATRVIADARSRFSTFRLLTTIAIIHALIPFVARVIIGRAFFGSTWPAIVISVSTVQFISFNFLTNTGFLVVGIIDFYRRSRTHQSLVDLISSGYRPQAPEGMQQTDVAPITCDFGYHENVSAWMNLRILTTEFGLGFRRRIEVFSTYFVLLMMVLVGYMSYAFFISGGNLEKSGANVVGLSMIIFEAITFTAFVFVVISYGEKCNNAAAFQQASLLKQKMRLRTQLLKEDDDPELLHCEALLETMIESLRMDAELHPVTFLGFKAGSVLARALLSLGATGVAFGIRLVLTPAASASGSPPPPPPPPPM